MHVSNLFNGLLNQGPFLILAMTFSWVFFFVGGELWLMIPIRVIAILGLFYHQDREKLKYILLSLFFIFCIYVWQNAAIVDNHIYLFGYWLLTLTMAYWMEGDNSDVATKLIGLTFLTATIQKILWGDYLDGEALHSLLLLDKRFQDFVILFDLLPVEAAKMNSFISHELAFFFQDKLIGFGTEIQSSETIRIVTIILSYLVVVGELLLALAFLLNRFKFFDKFKDVLLIAFIICTYGMVQVTGFGTLLSIMGFYQTKSDRVKKLYLGCFILVILLGVPWPYLFVS